MKSRISSFIAVSALCCVLTSWTPAGDNIRTTWGENIDPTSVLPEYPRPQMMRGEWKSLNGLWDYAITPADETPSAISDGQILVPFAVESSLSGVGKRIGKDDALWYRTTFTVPSSWKKERTILHFEAVDWAAEVSLNGKTIATHTGGYAPFEVDITPYLRKGSQTLTVKVLDSTDEGRMVPRGKQISNPGGIWYTPVTGIWQSVWIEKAPATRIASYYAVPDIDNLTLSVHVNAVNAGPTDLIRVDLLPGAEGYDTMTAPSDAEAIASVTTSPDVPAIIKVPDAVFWTPDAPYLYGLRITVLKNGKKSGDSVHGYTSMRKVSLVKSSKGFNVLGLNNTPLFQYGPLDQGWWPDGLYTAPTDEALLYDIRMTKELGFNMIRKHVKVEPSRWYWYCDRLGVMVWQDMPSITDSRTGEWRFNDFGSGRDSRISDSDKDNYRKEWKEIIDSRRVFNAIVVWVPFNEAWGQFDTRETVAYTRELDPTRLINPASGGNHTENCGDILDCHAYPNPQQYLWSPTAANVVGEYGGIGRAVEGHLWQKDRNWGYVQYASESEVTDTYVRYSLQILDLVGRGCSGAVYTQTSDVEGEINGLMTYDRKVIKLDIARVREANRRVIDALD